MHHTPIPSDAMSSDFEWLVRCFSIKEYTDCYLGTCRVTILPTNVLSPSSPTDRCCFYALSRSSLFPSAVLGSNPTPKLSPSDDWGEAGKKPFLRTNSWALPIGWTDHLMPAVRSSPHPLEKRKGKGLMTS